MKGASGVKGENEMDGLIETTLCVVPHDEKWDPQDLRFLIVWESGCGEE